MSMLKCVARKLLGMATLLSIVLFISGCKMDGDEEIEIHADGALTIRVNYQMPIRGLSLMDGRALLTYFQGLADRHESISVNELSCELAGNATVRLIAEIHTTDAMQLREIMAGESEMLESGELLDLTILAKVKAIIGDISIGVEGLSIKFRRSVQIGDLLKNELPSFNPDLLGDYQFRYSLTSPRAAKSHNATSTSNNGKTLIWVMPLKQSFEEPFTMQATLPIPIPWWVWLLVALAVLVILFILWKIFSYAKRKLQGS